MELLGKIRIVKTYGHLLKSHIPKIRSKCVKDSFMAGMYYFFGFYRCLICSMSFRTPNSKHHTHLSRPH